MKRRKFIYISTLILLCFCFSMLFSGCKENPINASVPDYATGDSYLSLVDDSYIFMIMDNGQATYYRQFLSDNRLLELGKIDDFSISTKDSVLFDNCIFFVASTQHSNEMKTSLYKIDLNSNTLSELTSDALCSFDAYPFLYQNNIAILKYYYEDTNIRSCVDVYNLSDGTTNTILSKNIDSETLDGSIILRAYSQDNEIATLTDLGQGENPPITNIEFFNSNSHLMRTVSIENIKSYIMESRVYQMKTFDNYIYMSNYSNYSILGVIENGEISPLLQERYLELAGGTTNIIFFLRGGNSIFILDSESEDIEEIDLDFNENFVIRTALSNDNGVLLVLRSQENNDESVHYFSLDQLSAMAIN